MKKRSKTKMPQKDTVAKKGRNVHAKSKKFK